MTSGSERDALHGVRILDFSRVLAGPFATMMLADLGAEVIKVERPGTGDETRGWGPPYDAARRRHLLPVGQPQQGQPRARPALRPADVERARALAAECDVVVENFRPGVMDELGLGYDTLSAANPRLVFCSITGFGRGAGAVLPGYDLLVQAVGGLMSITGPADGEPQKVGVALVDILTGLFASIGILAALRHAAATGEGQRVDVDLLSSLLAALVNQASGYTIAGAVPGRMGNAHPSIAPYELYPTQRGEIVIAVGNDRQFAALATVLGVPELAADPRYATNAQPGRQPRRAHAGPDRRAGEPAGRRVGRAADRGTGAGRRGQRCRGRVRARRVAGAGSRSSRFRRRPAPSIRRCG